MMNASPIQPNRTERQGVHFSIAGQHTQYMLAGYLRQVFLVSVILLAIALTIDLWPQIDMISASEGQGTLVAMWRILRFSALRTPDLVAPLLPFATFLGVFATEIAHTRSGERMLVWNSGLAPVQCLAPVIWLGLLLGPLEFTLDAYLGPEAMAVQMDERLGRDGQRLDRTRTGDSHWIAPPGGLLNTEIEYGPPPVLHNLTFYKLDIFGHPTEIDKAAVAYRQPGTNLWLMHDGQYWLSEGGIAPENAGGATSGLGGDANETMTPFANRTVQLDLNPLWLSVFGMETQYLRLPVLRALAHSDNITFSSGLYRTRLQVLYGEIFMPGAMALLAASLSLLLLPYRTPPRAVAGILLAGYFAHTGTKACLLLGQNDYIPPIVAGWFVPIAIFGATLTAFRLIGSRGSRARPKDDSTETHVPRMVSAE